MAAASNKRPIFKPKRQTQIVSRKHAEMKLLFVAKNLEGKEVFRTDYRPTMVSWWKAAKQPPLIVDLYFLDESRYIGTFRTDGLEDGCW